MARAGIVCTWIRIWCPALLFILVHVLCPVKANTNSLAKTSFSYIGAKNKDQAVFTSPSTIQHHITPSAKPAGAASSSSLASTSFYEPRGDYGGGAGGWGGGGGGGYGGGGGGGHSVYQYSLQPQPYYHPAPMYYDDGGYEGMEKGLIGLLGLGGLGGLKGLLGLLGLLKLLLPLLGLLLPLLLPLLLLKAAALLALILLIPVPVITTGAAGRRFKIPTTIEEGKAFLKDTVMELLGKFPTDINKIIGKIKDSSTTEVGKSRELKSFKNNAVQSKPSKTGGGKKTKSR